MANALTRHRQNLKTALQDVLTLPEAHLLENRYRTIRRSLYEAYPNLIQNTDKEVMLSFLKDVCYLDRILRLETEGEDKEKKVIASQEFQIGELGAEVGLSDNIKKLNVALN